MTAYGPHGELAWSLETEASWVNAEGTLPSDRISPTLALFPLRTRSRHRLILAAGSHTAVLLTAGGVVVTEAHLPAHPAKPLMFADITGNGLYDLLLTTQRPTLLGVFRHAGYEVFGLYHSVWLEWAERAYYGFDVYLSGPDLGYAGPSFGYWHIPDQYAFARFEQLHQLRHDRAPGMCRCQEVDAHFLLQQHLHDDVQLA